MPHGGINLEQIFYRDVQLRNYLDGVPHDSSTSQQYIVNSHHRPDNTVNPRDNSGWRSPSSFYHSLFREKSSYGTLARGDDWNGWVQIGPASFGFADNWYAEVSFPQKLEDRAVNDALNKLLDDGAGYGEDFATWQQTTDMVSEKKSLIAKSVVEYKKKYPNEYRKVKALKKLGRKVAGAIPGRWLELQYGWIPALQDVDAGMRIVADRLNNNSGRRHVISHKQEKTEKSILAGSEYPFADYQVVNGQPIIGDFTDITIQSSLVRMDFSIGNPALHAAAQLGLANPAQLAWNLLPYSFVVDWFLPVDSCLSALAAPWGLNFIGGSVTSTTNCKRTFVPKSAPYMEDDTRIFEFTPAENVIYSTTRSVLNDFPGPRMPRFKNPLSLTHFANATSLLVSAFK